MKLYINRDTGELMTREEMQAEWRELYDGDDATNILTWREQYDEVNDDEN